MTYSYFHPEEEFQVWAVEDYANEHPGTRFVVKFEDGETYICLFDGAYDSENGGELDIEMDNPLYDEFHQLSMRIVEARQEGLRRYKEWLSLDYRDFPVLVRDLDTGTVIYGSAP